MIADIIVQLCPQYITVYYNYGHDDYKLFIEELVQCMDRKELLGVKIVP